QLDRDEGMPLAFIAMGLQVGLVVAVETDGMRLVNRLGPAVIDRAVAAQIQAKLDAVAVKTAAPVELRGGLELMVLHAHALAREGTVELSPAFLHLRPRVVFK